MQATITSEALMVVDSAYTELTPAQVSNSKRLKHESRWRISR
jgi:histidinol-phosphate/aromatic aminotransferase/cobyric acid decarboxylase-like protein